MINALNAMLLIIVNNNLIKIPLDNAYVRKDILMIMKIIIYAKNALSFGIFL